MSDRQQPLRNVLHLGTGVAAPWILLAPRVWALAGLALALVVTVAVDLGRRHLGFRQTIDARLPGVFRPAERAGVSGATLLAAGYLLAAMAFPAPAAAGGILALAVGDRILMLENAIYSVISPEGCASILWKDAGKKEDAAEALKLTSHDLAGMEVIDRIVPEPLGGAHRDPDGVAARLQEILIEEIALLQQKTADELVEARIAKFARMGSYDQEGPA